MPPDDRIQNEAMPAKIDELRGQRETLSKEIVARQSDLHDLLLEVRRLDVDIARAEGAAPLETVVNELFTQRLASYSGGLTGLICAAFDTEGPALTSKDISPFVAEVLGLDWTEARTAKYVTSRVCICLWVMMQKGLVRKGKPRQYPQLWERTGAGRVSYGA